jgi:plastocyanin
MATPVIDRAALAAIVVAAALGCRGGPPPAPHLHTVAIRAMAFEPARLEVRVGDEIEWVNDDLVPHTATAPGAFDSAIIAPAARWRTRVTRPGDVAYACTLHPMMTGTVQIR